QPAHSPSHGIGVQYQENIEAERHRSHNSLTEKLARIPDLTATLSSSRTEGNGMTVSHDMTDQFQPHGMNTQSSLKNSRNSGSNVYSPYKSQRTDHRTSINSDGLLSYYSPSRYPDGNLDSGELPSKHFPHKAVYAGKDGELNVPFTRISSPSKEGSLLRATSATGNAGLRLNLAEHNRQPRSKAVAIKQASDQVPLRNDGPINDHGDEEPVDPNEEFKNSPINSASAVSGESAVLPCNISSPVDDDAIQLVLWYRDFVPTPIYSYDVRQGLYSRPKEWSDPMLLGSRAHFSVATTPAALVLNYTSKSDEAVYRCRVDFKHHITTHARVNLTVIEPITGISIQDPNGSELVGVAGPYPLGSAPSLVCRVVGGDPPPSITWWKNGHLLDQTYNYQESR
ncbi:Immunoglobulin V-set domain, partial [Trinorchestia longiramus]